MSERISKSAPKITLNQLTEAECTVRPKKGSFDLWSHKVVDGRANTNDGAWDELSKNPKLQRALSFIYDRVWRWRPDHATNKKSHNLICLSDEIFGADKTCFNGGRTEGQLQAVKDVLAGDKAGPLEIMAAFYAIPAEQFVKLEKLVTRDNDALLNDLTALANETDKEKVETSALDLVGRVSVNGTAQLAAAAFNKAAQLMKEDKANCDSQAVKDLQAMGTKWLKITRRLAHGRDAVFYQNAKDEGALDPLFDPRTKDRVTKRTSGLELYCGEKPAGAVAGAMRYFAKQGSLDPTLSGVSMAFLSGAMGAYEKAVANCGEKQCTRGTTRVGKKCLCLKPKKWFTRKGMKICEKPKKCRWNERYNRITNECIKKRRGMRRPMRHMDPPVMRPVVMGPMINILTNPNE